MGSIMIVDIISKCIVRYEDLVDHVEVEELASRKIDRVTGAIKEIVIRRVH